MNSSDNEDMEVQSQQFFVMSQVLSSSSSKTNRNYLGLG